MKKIVILLLVLISLFALSAFADSVYDGGPARLQAMGGQQIVPADESNIVDLYGAGFASAIFTRPAVSFISLYPEADFYSYYSKGEVYGKKGIKGVSDSVFCFLLKKRVGLVFSEIAEQ
jgi:hypothetical protein